MLKAMCRTDVTARLFTPWSKYVSELRKFNTKKGLFLAKAESVVAGADEVCGCALALRDAAEKVKPEGFDNDVAFKLLHDADMKMEELLASLEAAAGYLEKTGRAEIHTE